MRKLLRGATSSALFVLFGAGALLLSPLVLVLGRPERGQPAVRALWSVAVWLFVHTGLIRIECGDLSDVRGTVLVANHPSLIDVVLLTVLVPRTVYVAKSALRRNPFLSAIVRTTAIADDATFLETSAALLAKDWNILIFPEGTRTPLSGALGPFHRGAVQLSLRSRAPILPIGIVLTRRILAKRQAPWDMGERRVTYRFRIGKPLAAQCASGEQLHAAAKRVTSELESNVRSLMS